jgi:hypothetical protein
MELKIGDKCQYGECEFMATQVSCGKKYTAHPLPNVYCDAHADIVANEGEPEYTNVCPNCGCISGVN